MNKFNLSLTYCYYQVFVMMIALAGTSFAGAKYDPLEINKEIKINTADLSIKDQGRKRLIPLRFYLPKETGPRPVVIFSHGLGGSCKNNPYLGRHWALRGYLVVFIQHPGSDNSVWQGKPLLSRMKEMKKAASWQNLLLRIEDVHKLIDVLGKWNKQSGHLLEGRIDLNRIGMSGHSFGAGTTQAVSGQRTPFGKSTYNDKRITAAVMFSPNPPAFGNVSRAFGEVSIPWLLMTGSKDDSFISKTTAADRLRVYPALPEKGKYELVLYNAEHSAFGDRALPGDKEKRNPNHHRVILALTTAFWDSYLLGNLQAKNWLEGKGAESVLGNNDKWRFK